jgi:UDP-N-acetylglucosamine diphosphorylase/glucosamine-1-phosphate N-acetyltransferase
MDMTQSTRLLITDTTADALTPLTDMRAVFELRTGMLTTLQRIEQVTGLKVSALTVKPALQAVLKARYPQLLVNELPANDDSGLLLVSGQCTTHAILQQAARMDEGQQLCLPDGTTVAAHFPVNFDPSLDTSKLDRITVDADALIQFPWDIHKVLHENLVHDIELSQFQTVGKIADRYPGVTSFGDHAIKVHHSAKLQPGVILNSEAGPICIDQGVLVEAPAVIQGPCAICKGAMVAPMTQLRSDTVIGPVCKVGGEIKATIIAGYSNKAHAGYLGNALVGYWVNLGADTTASNLKNTYSPVRMQLTPNGQRYDTGLNNLGPIIGDYVRTGITTRMPTGTVIGTGTMIAQSTFTPTCVPPMRFITDKADQPYDADKLIDTIKAMMSRREQTMTDAEAERLRLLG